MKNILIYLILYFIISSSLFSTAVRHSCFYTGLAETATIGDSRAEQLVGLTGYYAENPMNLVSQAKINKMRVLEPGKVDIENRAQFGSMASEWVSKIDGCLAIHGIPFSMPKNSIMSLGGNDTLDYLKDKLKYKNVSTMTLLKNTPTGLIARLKPLFNKIVNTAKALVSSVSRSILPKRRARRTKSLKDLFASIIQQSQNANDNITGNPRLSDPDFFTQWEWQDGVALDRIVVNQKYVITKVLDQSPVHSLMLNTVAPPSPTSFGYAYVEGVTDPFDYLITSLKLFNGLQTRITRNLYPGLQSKYPGRIILVDVYLTYLRNVLYNHASYYLDGIHFSMPSSGDLEKPERTPNTGLEIWGQFLALSMVHNGWYKSYIPPIIISTMYPDVEMTFASTTINQRAKALGITDDLLDTDVGFWKSGFSKYFPQDPITITYMGYDYDFDNDKSFYHRTGTNTAYMVRGDIRTMYESNGGPDGRLGYPLQDETVGSIFESFRTQNFECGNITKNYFDLITPQKITMNETTPECLAKKARDAN